MKLKKNLLEVAQDWFPEADDEYGEDKKLFIDYLVTECCGRKNAKSTNSVINALKNKLKKVYKKIGLKKEKKFMRFSFRKLLLIYFIGFLVSLNCLGVDKQSKPLMIAAAIQKAQSVMDRYPVETPPPLVYPDGTPLHDSVNSVYQISMKDGEDIVSFKESAETLKVLERENIEKIVADFPKLFFAPTDTARSH